MPRKQIRGYKKSKDFLSCLFEGLHVKETLINIGSMCTLKKKISHIYRLLPMSYRVEQHKGDVLCFSILTDTRQEIFLVIHLTTLAIYCQAQDKSFCIYFAAICSITTIPSILVQVEDMSDLETVHMLYLTESLRICFLSNETRSTAKIIQKILQCSMDYRSCLTGRIWEGRSFDEKSSNRFSEIDVSQNVVSATFGVSYAKKIGLKN
ncbi:uncharacterized protein LOC142553599 isoform X2 [Primulina tabacum]|uniref:uncharacterized protein LOC142553599 isoform X2 n=1 Tax=Primulina tabacum TaxID=48773 RepID=UPI003F5A6560